MIPRRPVAPVPEPLEVALAEVVASEEDDRRRLPPLDRGDRVLKEVQPRGAAVRVLQEPAQTQPEAPGEVDRVVRVKRERGDAEPVNLSAVDAGTGERAPERVREQALGRRPRRRVARVGRLGGAGDHGLGRHPCGCYGPRRILRRMSVGAQVGLREALLELIPDDKRVSAGDSVRDLHAADYSLHPPHRPDVVVYPTTTAEVARVLALANARRVPGAALRARTSLEGHVIPVAGGISPG